MLAQVVTGRGEGGYVWEVNNEERSEVGPFFSASAFQADSPRGACGEAWP